MIPVTANVDRVFPFQVLLAASETGLERDSKARAEQVRSLSVERVARKLGTVPPAFMYEVDEALRLHLSI